MSKRVRDEEGSESTSSGMPPKQLQRVIQSRLQKSTELRAKVKEAIENTDPEELLNTLCARWEVDAKSATFGDFSRLAFKNFTTRPDAEERDVDLDAEWDGEFAGFGLRQLDEAIEEQELEAMALCNRIKQLDPTGERPELQLRAAKVIEMVYYARKAVMSAFQARLAVHQLHSADLKLAPDLEMLLGSWSVRFRWIDLTKSTPLQRLLLHLLDTSMEKRYRKHMGYVYEPIVVQYMGAEYETHAWRMVCDIKEFVYESTKKELHWDQWCNLTASGNNVKTAVDHLACTKDLQFPHLEKDRSVFAFRNGVYVARDDTFYRFGADVRLSDRVVAAKFFDAELETYDGVDDWRHIPTPNLQRIMDFQEWSPEVCEWLYIMLGRLLYNLGEKDHWEVAPFLLGAASSGKSTITVKVAKLFYEDVDVGVLSNNIEKQFGLSAFAKKLLVVAPELKSDLKLDQTEMQSMISGESIQVAEKHKTAYSAEWKVPVIMAGNEVPSYVDNSGSVQRRFLVWAFEKAVANGDTKLAEKLATEIGTILLKCNRAYLEAVARFNNRLIWSVLPSYFIGTRQEMAQAVNSIEAFLDDTREVVIHADAWCPYKQFRDAWLAFARANSYKQDKVVSKKLFRTPFSNRQIRFSPTVETREYRGATVRDDFLLGVDLVAATSAAVGLG